MGCMDFRRPLSHQPLEVVAGGGALVFTDQGGKDLSDETGEIAWGMGGLCVHNLTLRPTRANEVLLDVGDTP